MKTLIKRFVPPICFDIKKLLSIKNQLYYSEEFKTWEDALIRSNQLGGDYEDKGIIDQVDAAIQKVRRGEAEYEQDGVVFYEKNNNWQLLSSLLYVNSILNFREKERQRLSVLDMGGALGSTFFRYKDTISEIGARWCVVEQKHYVDRGRKAIPEIEFYYSVKEAIESANTPNVLLLSGVLMYLDNPYEMLKDMLKYDFSYVIVDENAFFMDENSSDKIMIQHTPSWIYKAVYPAHIFGLKKFREFFIECGYEIKWEWIYTGGSIPIKSRRGLIDTIDKGFLFKKR